MGRSMLALRSDDSSLSLTALIHVFLTLKYASFFQCEINTEDRGAGRAQSDRLAYLLSEAVSLM